MQSKTQWFRLSIYALGLAALTVIGVPVGCAVTTQDNSGWDFLSDDIRFLSAMVILVVFLLLVSLVTGILALKQHKVAAMWVLPLGLTFIGAVGFALYGLYVYLFDPFGVG